MRRRRFLALVSRGAVVGLVGCKIGSSRDPDDPAGDGVDAGSGDASDRDDGAPVPPADAAPGCDAGSVIMYDTYAQALYMDGTLGPLTGIIHVDYILAGQPVTLQFWHGHGGVDHMFTLTPGHYAQLIAGHKVTLVTTLVDDHQHELFIDPTDPDYRVPDAPPTPVPLGC